MPKPTMPMRRLVATSVASLPRVLFDLDRRLVLVRLRDLDLDLARIDAGSFAEAAQHQPGEGDHERHHDDLDENEGDRAPIDLPGADAGRPLARELVDV